MPLDWRPGQPVTLSLIASPAKRAPSPRVHGVRVGPRKRIGLPGDQREGWLRRKLAGAVDITSVAGCHLGTRTGRRPGGIVIHPWHALTVRATVRDPRMLAALVLAGVGPAKGYGCGLLTVQQAR